MAEAAVGTSNQYLTFTLDEEVFALEIAKVREVLEFSGVTKVPRTPEFMRGVINLRGSVVPVVDLKRKFGMGTTERSVDTCVIIAEVELEGETAVLGALADSVQEVLDLEPAQIEPPPRMGNRMRTEFIRGMGKRDDQFLILLDIDRVFSTAELATVRETGGG
ncbi:MAG: chemotaxis protein CheW [Proteobacteria bacterium]|nr:chemotaxis protein CheW [Pseudomonadota bacterium]